MSGDHSESSPGAQQVVEELISAFAADRDQFSTRVEELARPADIAMAAHETSSEALDDGQFERAEAALSIEAACLDPGDLVRLVDVGIRIAEVKKVLATDVPAYDFARTYAQAMAGISRKMKRPQSRFEALAVAADSAYFAADTLRGHDDDGYRQWLRTALDDALEAVILLPAASQGRGSHFLNMLLATVDRLMPMRGSESDTDIERTTLTRPLRRAALALEGLLDPEGAPDVSAAELLVDASILARLSYGYGSPDAAFVRISDIVARAASEADVSTFLHASEVRYEGEREAFRTSAHLRDLRRTYRENVGVIRQFNRSRAGRLRIAELVDRTMGAMATDEFADEVDADATAAFESMESGKARCLLDEVAGSVRPIADAALRQTARTLETELLHLPAFDQTTAASDEFLLLSRLPFGGITGSAEAPEQLAALEQIYADTDAGFVGGAAITDLAKVSAQLADDETIISYQLPFDPLDPSATLLILWIRRDRSLALHLPLIYQGELPFIGRLQADGGQPLDVGPLMNNVAMTRHAIREGEDALADLAQLYEMFLAPIVEYGFAPEDYSRVIVVPSGVLHMVPFAALRCPDGAFLIEKAPLVVAPSVSVWQHLAARPDKQPPRTFLGFANPSLQAGWEPLPGAEREVAGIVDDLPGLDIDIRTGIAATESAFVEHAGGRDLIHFATHGEFPENDAVDLHRIVLAAEGDHDGLLNAEEIRRTDLSAAQLVVLSICDGALVRFGPGDEPLGLLPAFFAAGVTNIVAPLWEIGDVAATEWMCAFYRDLLDLGPARAVQRACLERIRAGAQVRDWAAFSLVGLGRPFTRV